jgi:hypothetical protein
MDQNSTSIIILVTVSVLTSMFTSIMQFLMIALKVVKRSSCCGGTLEMKNIKSSEKMSPDQQPTQFIPDKSLDIILERLEHKRE